MFEFSPFSGVLPSYFTETLLYDADLLTQRAAWLNVCLCITCWFAMLELIEIVSSMRSDGVLGVLRYCGSLWNILDWVNFLVFYYVYILLNVERSLSDRDLAGESCMSYLCKDFGYFDAWQIFEIGRLVKLFLSFCVCIQFLKVIKFTNELIPKMSLFTRVLTKGAYDLIFFAVVFGISMFAFCMLFYIQLGSAIDNFYSNTYSMLALTRSLFGDFNFEEIMENSRNYINAVLFLVYLFVAVFILLALFLSILGEAQSGVRETENEEGLLENEYGVISDIGGFAFVCFDKLCHPLAKRISEANGSENDDETPPSEEEQRKLLLVQSLKAFKPNFLDMVDSHLGKLEKTFASALNRIEANLEEHELGERQNAHEKDKDASSLLAKTPLTHPSLNTGRGDLRTVIKMAVGRDGDPKSAASRSGKGGDLRDCSEGSHSQPRRRRGRKL